MLVTSRLFLILIFALASSRAAEPQTVVDDSAAWLEASEVSQVKRIVSDEFADPLATQFRRLSRAGGNEKVICGEVNAKNAYGAYVGFDPFTLDTRTGRVAIFSRNQQSGSLDRDTDEGMLLLIGCRSNVRTVDAAEEGRLKDVARWHLKQRR